MTAPKVPAYCAHCRERFAVSKNPPYSVMHCVEVGPQGNDVVRHRHSISREELRPYLDEQAEAKIASRSVRTAVLHDLKEEFSTLMTVDKYGFVQEEKFWADGALKVLVALKTALTGRD